MGRKSIVVLVVGWFLAIVFAATAWADGAMPQLAWAKRLHRTANDRLQQLRLGADHSVTVAGVGRTAVTDDLITVRYSAKGVELWQADFPLPMLLSYLEGAWTKADLAVDADGAAYVTSVSPDGDGVWHWTIGVTAKYDDAGHLAWSRHVPEAGTYAAGFGTAITTTPDGGVASAGGLCENIKICLSCCSLAKFDPAGSSLWQRTYYSMMLPDYQRPSPTAIVADEDGSLYLTGQGASALDGAATLKIDEAGNLMWLRALPVGGGGETYSTDLAVDAEQNVFVALTHDGRFAGIGYGPGGGRLFLKKGPPGIAYGVAVTPQGEAAFAGASTPESDSACTTMLVDNNGAELWTVYEYGPAGEPCEAFDVAVDEAGQVYAAGAIRPEGTTRDIFVVKYDHAGNRLWTVTYAGEAGGDDHAERIVVDGAAVYVAGNSTGAGTGLDLLTLKYLQPDSDDDDNDDDDDDDDAVDDDNDDDGDNDDDLGDDDADDDGGDDDDSACGS